MQGMLRQQLAPDEPIKTLSFTESQRQRLCFRNERSLYRRKCDATGEEIISIYSPDKPYKVYKSEYWYGDKWDALSYGREPDFDRPFFDQLHELHLIVPRLALSNGKNINSDYGNMTFFNKNCYMLFGGDFNEDAMYGTLCMHNKDVTECDYSYNCELCYEIQDCEKCYNTDFAMDSKSCTDCSYISDCIGCHNCILSTNLVNQSYCIENRKLTKEEYERKKTELNLETNEGRARTYERFLRIHKERIVKFAHLISCENCTGDYLKNCKNCFSSFDASGCEDMQDIIFAMNCKDCVDCSLLGDKCELCYDTISALKSFNVKHSNFTLESYNIEYCDFNMNSSNLFGCIGLRHARHCILNRQYEPAEYKILSQKLVEHMKRTGEYGQFLPPKLSCFGYNESTANTYFPLTREEALAQGYKWTD